MICISECAGTTWKTGLDGKDNIKIVVQEVGLGHGLKWCCWGYGQVAGCFEHSTGPSGSI